MHAGKKFNKDTPLSAYTQSDHLGILMNIDFETIENLRTPRIDKERMIKRIQGIKGRDLDKMYQDPLGTFINIRNEMKSNILSILIY